MAWYHFIATYLLIAAGVMFTIIPDKPLGVWVAILVCSIIGILMGVFLPHKEDKYSQKGS